MRPQLSAQIHSYTYDPAISDACAGASAALTFYGTVAGPITLVGRPRVRLLASSSALDTEFWATLDATGPGLDEGTLGGIRARFRLNDVEQPLLSPGQPTVFEFQLDRRVMVLRAGTVLTLRISSSLCGESENPNTGEDPGHETGRRSATQVLFLDGRSTITFDALLQ